MSPTNRFIAVLYTVFGVGIFAIAYSGIGVDSPVFSALRIFVATGAVFIAVHGILRRSAPALLIAAGLAVQAFGFFAAPNRLYTYVGIALFLGGFFLLTRSQKLQTPIN